MAGLFNEIDVKGLYGGVKAGAPLSTEEAQSLGLPQLNPLQDELERIYRKHVTENPEQNAARVWNAQRVGVPQWIQDRDEMYKKEAEYRLALLEKKSPDWTRMVAFSPATSKFLQHDDVMASAYDDVDNLAAMEKESKRAAMVKENLNGLLQRGASGRNAIIRSLRSIAPAPTPAAATLRNPPALMGRDTIMTDDSDPFRQLDVALGNWFRDTDLGKGVLSGEEMSAIGRDATNLFAKQSAGGKVDESEWVDLEKRMLALDREAPSGWFSGMLYESGKMIGQQISGAMTTGGMATIGAAGAIVGGGLAALTAPVSLPALAIGTTMTAAAAWGLGTAMGVFTQSAKTEGGIDLITRRMMSDENGDHLSPMAVGLGSMAVGAVNGAIELLQLETALGPMNKIASSAMRPVIARVGARIAALPAITKMGGMALKDWGINTVTDSMQEVFQDAFPIAIDEMQKASLLNGYDARTIGDINAQLTNTFTQSLYSFALISAIGPIGAGLRGDYRIELGRKEIEAYQTQNLNSKLDNFNASIGVTKLLKRIPGMSKDFAGELLSGADARTVYVPATSVQQMFQDGLIETEQQDAAAWAEEALGVDPEDFRASLEGGPDIEIEAIKLFDSVPDKAQDAIRKSMRFSADGMTLGEAEAMNDRITKIRQGDLFDVSYELEREVSEAASAQKVFESMRLQMEAQGMDHETAANTAWMASRMYIPLARMWNEKSTRQDLIMPEDVAEMFPISFTQNDDGSMGIYYQALGEKGAGQLDAAEMVTMRLDNLAAAKKELAAGKDPLKIKMAYGWELGVDGKWRMETDDHFRLKKAAGTKEWRDLFSHPEKYGPAKYALLKEVISYDEMFAAYPDLAEIKVYVDLDDEGVSGYYSGRENAIHLSFKTGNNSDDVFDTLTHEIQHAIQAREGFARGGSTEMFNESIKVHTWLNDLEEAENYHRRGQNRFETGAKMELEKILRRYNVETIEELRSLYEKETKLGRYKRLAGEVEARNATRRLEMSYAERKASLLSETEDVSREDQIILDSMLRKAEMAEELRYFQAAYHGSPHKFDRFNLRKIGTGEGNQAYGWGLYFTETQMIARDYRNALIERSGKSMSDIKFSGKTLSEWHKHFERLANKAGVKERKRYYDLMSLLEDFETTWDSQSIVDRLKVGELTSDPEFDYDPYAVEWFTKNIHNSKLKPGAIYKVELPDDAGQYLMWDEQVTEETQKKIIEGLSRENYDAISNWIKSERKKDPNVADIFSEDEISDEYYPEDVLRDYLEQYLDFHEAKGESVYTQITEVLGSAERASKFLNQIGFVGIKYLDGNSRNAGKGSYNYVIFDDNAVEILETYNQAVNSDVDPDILVKAVDISATVKTTAKKDIKDLDSFIKTLAPMQISTADNKAIVDILKKNAAHIAHSGAPVLRMHIPVRNASIMNIMDLVSASVVIESVPNNKISPLDESMSRGERRKINRKNSIGVFHRLYVPVTVDGKNFYTVRLVAEEKKGNIIFDPKSIQLYDLIIEKEEPPLTAASQKKLTVARDGSWVSVRDMLRNVNDYSGNPYFTQQNRGSITFPRQAGQPIRISWSKNADASTVIHELAHFYLWQLRQFRSTPSVTTGRYGKQAMDDLDLISGWWSDDAQQITDWIQKQTGMSETVKAGATEVNFINWINSGMERETELGKAFDVAAHEYFARGFEAYMREGRAPTAELQSVFRRFKKWLTDIYKSLTELNVELSDDVRAVYDRMLASEESIEQFKAEMEVEELLRSEEDNIPDDYPFDDEDLFEAAKERLLGILMDEISPENRKKMISRADEIRPRIAAEVSTEKGWTTVNMYEENPDRRMSESEIMDRYGETVISQLSPAVMDPDGISVEIAAKDMNYGSADELIEDLTGKTSLHAEIDSRVKAQIEREFASIINDPAKLDAAAEAAWYEGEEHSDDLAADMVVPMSEYAEIYAEDEAAAAEQESPRNRRNVIGWIKSHGGLLYSSVSTEFGKERAQELIKKTGPGIFSKTGFGLDELAQEMSGNGIPVDSDEDLFNILMGEDAKQSPLDIAREEGRAEALKEAKMKRALDMMVKAEKKRLGKEIKQRYDEQIKGVKSAAETAAENIVGIMPIEKLRDTAKYIRAEKEARRKADAALRKNDETEFRRWRERELMQHMIVKQMYRSQRQAEGIRSWLERYAKRTNTQTFGMTPNFVEQVDAILTRFDIRKTRSMTAKQRATVGEAPSLDNFIREMDAEGTPILIDDWIIQTQERRHYTQLMLWQFKEVQNAVKNIVTVGRQEKQTIALMQNEKLSDIADKIYSAAKAFYGEKVTGEKILDPEEIKKNIIALAGGALADIETVEAMCRALDGYVDMGPAQRYIFQPIRAAMTRETLELNRVFSLARDMRSEAYGSSKIDNWSRTFDDIYKYKEVTLPNGKVKYVPTDQKLTLTREMAISAVLNMGNEGNRSRLMTGWGWTNENMAEILGTLNEQDIKYVQGIWNLVESLWPQVKKVHELMTGLTLEKVDATPLETKYGKITGGYYPIVTDLRYSTQAAAQTELETALTSTTLGFAHTYTKSGHRKLRAVDVEGRPPLLSLSVLDNHLANVIHDFEVAPALRDVRKILRHPTVETTIDQVLGKKRRQNINKWLNDVAGNTKNNGIAMSDGDRLANKAISGTAMFALGANVTGALMQPLGYFALAHRIGFVRTARAILNGLMGNRDIYSFVLEKSDFMRDQYRGQTLEVRRLRQNWSSQSGGLKWWQDRMLDIYPMMQNLCNVPGWAEAYKMGIKKFNGNEADAIAFADSIIRQTQSASNLADLTTFERSGTWQRWVSMFYSWFRVMYQMQNEALMKVIHGHGLRGRFGDLASYVFYILICQNVAESLLRGYGPDDDDEDGEIEIEEWVKWTAKQAFLSPLSTVPLVRDLARGAEIGRYTFSPAEASLRSIFKLIQAADKVIEAEPEDRDLEPLVWSGAEVVGYSTGLPNRVMLRAAKAFWELYNEDEAIPWAYVILGGGFRPKKNN